MNASPPADRRFTVEQANRMLPLIRAIVSDIVELAGDLTQRNDRLGMLQVSDAEEGDPYSEEVLQMQREIERDMDRLQAFVDELAELGVELKSATEGLVDFKARIDNRDAYLCWKLGEEEVGHWHPLNAGFEGRQSLLEGASAGDALPGGDTEV
jgi:hypothetical protein